MEYYDTELQKNISDLAYALAEREILIMVRDEKLGEMKLRQLITLCFDDALSMAFGGPNEN